MTESIDAVRKLHPIRNLLHVGNVGRRTLTEYAEWACPAAIFVIPDKVHQRSLIPIIEAHPGWSSLRAVVAASAAEREYFNASNPRESGLVSPDSLVCIWRNLKAVSRHIVPVTTLDVVIKDIAANVPAPNWLVVDCLPALPVMQGATSCLEVCDVVMARAVIDESLVIDPSTSLSALDEDLTRRGFRRLAIQEERHPALGTALFARDWKSLYLEGRRELNSERVITARKLAVQTNLAADCKMQIGELIADRDEQIRLADQRAVRAADDHSRLLGERERHIERLSAEHDRIAQNLAAQVRLTCERESTIVEITADREQQRRLANQRHKEWEQAVADRDAYAQIADEMQEQAGELLRTREQIERRLTESEEKTAVMTAELHTRDERIGELLAALERVVESEKKGSADLREVRDQVERLNAAFEERGVRITELEAERANLDARQIGLEREIQNAEAQIDLIKDVILRDKAF